MTYVEIIQQRINETKETIALIKRKVIPGGHAKIRFLTLQLKQYEAELKEYERLGVGKIKKEVDYKNDVIIAELDIEWIDVTFEYQHITVKTPFTDEPLEFYSENSRSIYNWVRESMAGVIENLHLTIYKLKKPRIANLDILDDLFKCLAVKELFESEQWATYGINRYIKNYPPSLSSLLLPDRKDRSEYINTLYSKQCKECHLIPLWEQRPDGKEESFIFSLRSHCGYGIVLESCHHDRATYVILVSSCEYEKAIQRLFDFFTSELKRKRSLIRSGKAEDILGFNAIAVDHNNLEGWVTKLDKILWDI